MIKNKLPETNLTLSDFYYELPQEYIAQTPIEPRDSSRLMIFDRRSGELKHEIFKSIINYINPEDILVLNDTRVIPARIIGHRTYRIESTDKRSQLVKSTGTAPVELLLLKQTEHNMWEALAGPGKRARPGDIIEFGGGKLNAYIENIIDGGCRLVRLEASEEFHTIYDALNELGSTPLPPYITEKLDNPERYQTVYSKIAGSAAAPTAGLHFTHDLLNSIRSKGCGITHVLLHVGLGTFRPVKENNISEHVMHSEFISVSDSAAEEINERRKKGGRIIAVGTTSCRVLESVSDENGIIRPYTGDTGIFIYPGYKFKATDALITNFHLPESTLLMLVSAFAGKEQVLNAYKTAVNLKYRFFSFGDAMFIG